MRSVLNRGILYTLAIVFNRLVPASICRVFFVRVVELGPKHDNVIDDRVEKAISSAQRQSLAEVTLQSSSDLEVNRVGWAILGGSSDEATASEKLIGGCWVAETEAFEPDMGLRWVLPDGGHWLSSARLDPSHRGHGCYGRLLDHTLNHYRGQPVFACINPINRRSIAAHASRVRGVVGNVIAVRVFRRTWAWTRGAIQPRRRTYTTPMASQIDLVIDDVRASQSTA
ncbi:MAG: hypothetical protein AAF539_00360 [Planctomycetota bacterium]